MIAKNKVGIEAINFYGGSACIDLQDLAKLRNLESQRFDNLLMKQRSVALPFEDPVTYAVNAAFPIIQSMSPEDVKDIKLVIACTESGVDFSKSITTYIHDYLGLSRHCRVFELKQACYSGTAGFQMAVNFILSNTSPGDKALVIATDIARFMIEEGADVESTDWSYAEPSGGAGAVAMLISDTPKVFSLDIGAHGNYSYEVMDTCRPSPDSEAGDADLSLLSYLDCCEFAFKDYQSKVEAADYKDSFQYLAFHTPFGGMIKGAHRSMMRKLKRSSPAEIELDFQQRVEPGLHYAQVVGNIMGASLFLSLVSTICNGHFDSPKRIGCFSYGSGCCSEFFSGVVTPEGADALRSMQVSARLNRRYKMSMTEYEKLLTDSSLLRFGTRNTEINLTPYFKALDAVSDQAVLVLSKVNEFHREYTWLNKSTA